MKGQDKPKKLGKKVAVKDTPPMKGVDFTYALDLSRCVGCRRCVYACVKENNQSRKNPQIHWIRVLEMEKARGISVSSTALQFNYHSSETPDEQINVINLVDTPGHSDFSEDTYRVLTAVDAAVMLIDAAKGNLALFEKAEKEAKSRGRGAQARPLLPPNLHEGAHLDGAGVAARAGVDRGLRLVGRPGQHIDSMATFDGRDVLPDFTFRESDRGRAVVQALIGRRPVHHIDDPVLGRMAGEGARPHLGGDDRHQVHPGDLELGRQPDIGRRILEVIEFVDR